MWENADQNNSKYGHFSRGEEDCDNILVSLLLHLNKIKTLIVLLNILAKLQQCFNVYAVDHHEGFQISLLLKQNLAPCSGIFPSNSENPFRFWRHLKAMAFYLLLFSI